LRPKDYNYDLVISSYAPWTNHIVAKNIVKKIKKNKKSFWIQDYRDPVIQSSTPFFLRPILSFMLDRVTSKSDLITYCAPLKEAESGFWKKSPSYMLENGFDSFINKPLSSDDISKYSLENDKIKICYAGTLYDKRSDLSPIFDAIEMLITQRRIPSNRISFYYFGNSQKYFDVNYRNEELFDNFSFNSLDRENIFSIYNHMDIIVSAAWVYKNFPLEGDPSSKIYELINLDKILVGIVKKDIGAPNSYLCKLLNRYDKGFCYEISNEYEHKSAVSEIMNLILSVESHRHLIAGGNRINNEFEDLSWLEITRRFIRHLDSILFEKEEQL
jgi:hypothetical protein